MDDICRLSSDFGGQIGRITLFTNIYGLHGHRCYNMLAAVFPTEAEEYAKAIRGARVALCFLSRLNRDTYTRRCFEIPACGTVLASERTRDLQRLFKEDEEAVLFSSPEELVRKVLGLKAETGRRKQIAEAGYRRVQRDGHGVDARMKGFIDLLLELRAGQANVVDSDAAPIPLCN